MTLLVPVPGVAVVEGSAVLYVARLPEGPIAVLDGVGAVIWAEACNRDRETLAARVAAKIEPMPAEIDQDVDAFVEALIGLGLLREGRR